MCREVLPYNTTGVYNIFNHTDHQMASIAVHEWQPLVKYGCSNFLQNLLCHRYIPPCSNHTHTEYTHDGIQKMPLPCRDLCERIRFNCSHVMDEFGFHWPNEISCQTFPVVGNCTSLASVDGTGSHSTHDDVGE